MQDVTLFAVRDGTGREAETIRQLRRPEAQVEPGHVDPEAVPTQPLPQAGPVGGTHPLSVCPTRVWWSRAHMVGRYRKVNGSTNIPLAGSGLGRRWELRDPHHSSSGSGICSRSMSSVPPISIWYTMRQKLESEARYLLPG